MGMGTEEDDDLYEFKGSTGETSLPLTATLVALAGEAEKDGAGLEMRGCLG